MPSRSFVQSSLFRSQIQTDSIHDRKSLKGRSGKKISVVNKNNNIMFPKERRFVNYVDGQSDRISYLQDINF
jgi:hypothetical protein